LVESNRKTVVQFSVEKTVQVESIRIAESIWPNSAYADGCGFNTLTGADPIAPFGGAAFHDN
jgi:hypothetical protein